MNVTLLHGFCENQQIWNPVLSAFAEHNLQCLDLPGFGENYSDIRTMDDMANNVIEQLDQLGIDTTCIIGHSMGGYVALNILNRFPDRLTGIGLFHSTAIADTEEKKTARDRAIEHVQQFGSDGYLKEMSRNLIWQNHPKRSEISSEVFELIKHEKPEGIINALGAMRDRLPTVNTLNETELPVLVVAGRYDSFINWRDVFSQVSKCKRAMVELLEDCGHLGQFESPEKSSVVLRAFVNWVEAIHEN